MDLEHLTKHQIILLTLLVSFVTSIATGIVTVSLMNQAAPSVSRTINQIVERTIQTVVPTTGGPVVTTEKTIVVKDDDLASQSITSVQKSIIRITAKGGDELLARGVIIDSKGTALTDQGSLVATGAELFDAILYDGTRVGVIFHETKATTTPLATVMVAIGTSTGVMPAAIADITKLRLGQSVLRIGGKGVDSVGSGVIAMLPTRVGDSTSNVEATVSSATPGSLLMTIFGEIIGIATTNSLSESPSSYTTVAKVPLAPGTKTPFKK